MTAAVTGNIQRQDDSDGCTDDDRAVATESHDMVAESFDMAAGAAYPVLPEIRHSIYPAIVQIHADMFRVCPSGIAKTWTVQRTGTRRMAHSEMQPLGWFGLRSSTLRI